MKNIKSSSQEISSGDPISTYAWKPLISRTVGRVRRTGTNVGDMEKVLKIFLS